MDSLLRSAISDGQLEAVREYLANDFNPNQLGRDRGRSLLEYALSLGNLDICEELLNAGAVCSEIGRAIIEDSYENLNLAIGGSSLRLQASVICLITTKQYHMLRRLLIDYGCDINFGNGLRTPLHLAVTTNNYPIVELLMECGANPQLTNADNENVLDLAFKNSITNRRSEFAQQIYCLIYERFCY